MKTVKVVAAVICDSLENKTRIYANKSSFVDGFYITPRELNASRRYSIEGHNQEYQIYRVYNFEPVNKTASIKIYHAPYTDEMFRFAPTAWKVHLR